MFDLGVIGALDLEADKLRDMTGGFKNEKEKNYL